MAHPSLPTLMTPPSDPLGPPAFRQDELHILYFLTQRGILFP